MVFIYIEGYLCPTSIYPRQIICTRDVSKQLWLSRVKIPIVPSDNQVRFRARKIDVGFQAAEYDYISGLRKYMRS